MPDLWKYRSHKGREGVRVAGRKSQQNMKAGGSIPEEPRAHSVGFKDLCCFCRCAHAHVSDGQTITKTPFTPVGSLQSWECGSVRTPSFSFPERRQFRLNTRTVHAQCHVNYSLDWVCIGAFGSQPIVPVPGYQYGSVSTALGTIAGFYWPDIVDPLYPYGEGMQLQLRSAISHVNEVWAVEAGGVILSAFADVLPWEWIYNSARWTYDESRHCRMGYERLMAWGFDPAEIPLGTYIYESATTADVADVPTNLLGMLFFFETKNIRHKPERARLFVRMATQ